MAFTDIVGSTALNGRLGDRVWFDLLKRHDDLVRAHVVANGGTEVKGQGDGFLLTFASARRALCFATDLQAAMAAWRESEGAPIHVRIGVHTGEVIRVNGDLFGRHVNYAARVAALADADQILASQLVHELAAPMGDFRFGPPMSVELKGFDGSQVVHAVVAS
jgi:class 3 adenylate cyclase